MRKRTSRSTISAARAAAAGCGLWAFGLGVCALFLIGCGDSPPIRGSLISDDLPTMGTRFRFTAEATWNVNLDTLGPRISDRLAVVSRRFSTYDPDSELSKFNASESTDWFPVSDETARVVDYCLRLAEDSGGAFDPTIGPLVNVWGFGPDGSVIEPPSDAAIADAKSRISHEKVESRLDPPALRKLDTAVYLDLSAAAKGYGVDAMSALFLEESIDHFLVEIGGEIRTRGNKPDGSPWRIGVEAPDTEGRRVQRVVEPGDAAVATSGDYRNFFEHEGVRYSHTIDPATGQPVTHDLATVSVVADTCLEADGLATALLVMGPERGYDWATERGVAALFVSRAGDDTLTERTTPAWDERLAEDPLPSPTATTETAP